MILAHEPTPESALSVTRHVTRLANPRQTPRAPLAAEAILADPAVAAALADMARRPSSPKPYGPPTQAEHWAAWRLAREFAAQGGAL